MTGRVDFSSVYGVFLKDGGVEVGIVPSTKDVVIAEIHEALTKVKGVKKITTKFVRSATLFHVHPRESVHPKHLAQLLAEKMEVVSPQNATCIMGRALVGVTTLECVGVIFDEPDPTYAGTVDTICTFTDRLIGPTKVNFADERGFVIAVKRRDPDNPDVPTLPDALCFVQIQPSLETVESPVALRLFVQMVIARFPRK